VLALKHSWNYTVFVAAIVQQQKGVSMQTVTFVLLQLLTSLWQDDENWQANVRDSGLEAGYTLATDGDAGEMVTQDFACDELEFAKAAVYDFAGSATEEERFYGRDEQVYRDKATGRLWLMWREDIDEF
jgi:hypothetical protein